MKLFASAVSLFCALSWFSANAFAVTPAAMVGTWTNATPRQLSITSLTVSSDLKINIMGPCATSPGTCSWGEQQLTVYFKPFTNQNPEPAFRAVARYENLFGFFNVTVILRMTNDGDIRFESLSDDVVNGFHSYASGKFTQNP